MPTLTQPLTNNAYGFPTRGAKRRIKPTVLAVIHITGNSGNLGPTAAQAERNYANRVGSGGPSAHTYLGRSVEAVTVDAINPTSYAAWSNGDFNKPNALNAGVARLLALKAKGYNGNEGVYWEVECVGYPVTAETTAFQLEFIAGRLARYSIAQGIPISRTTVLGHFDINSVDRARCPFPVAVRERRLGSVIKRANEIKAALLAPVVVPAPAPAPAPAPVPATPAVVVGRSEAEYQTVVAQLAAAQGQISTQAQSLSVLDGRLATAKAHANTIVQL